ncbi:hypothetical protein BST81_12545 [Leptolyngbya sp. 'hensonii']|uniref:hypothetical protein n=1 Tax=Leptolyngbya sp. 'hensonii' TaxID=1922337 RepID=UPI00096495E6|nr:hypothetical protein [Leptolyngbya sp. 'hensonii']OLP17882.1 hypothetical protein BST81_12545 [Leptolyngbya sp. 'hensonii']
MVLKSASLSLAVVLLTGTIVSAQPDKDAATIAPGSYAYRLLEPAQSPAPLANELISSQPKYASYVYISQMGNLIPPPGMPPGGRVQAPAIGGPTIYETEFLPPPPPVAPQRIAQGASQSVPQSSPRYVLLRPNPSYLGIAGNVGLTGDSSDIGRPSFAVFTKLPLANFISLRPAVFVNRDAAILVPLTLDFPSQVEAFGFTPSPFFGGGIAVTTGPESRAGALITTGVDFPVTRELTATTGLNLGFLRNTDVGLYFGLGYTFGGF